MKNLQSISREAIEDKRGLHKNIMSNTSKKLKTAYFSMEFGLHSDVPTYAGGLGMLAGDILRSCADLEIPAAGISLAYHQGFTNQIINPDGSQDFETTSWEKSEYMQELSERIKVKIEDRDIFVKAWKYEINGLHGFSVPVYLLDTNVEENDLKDRDITKELYTSDWYTRLAQEVVLGIGGVRMLRGLGYKDIENFHMNEGHSALLTLELLRERDYKDDEVKKSCVFTTHTPVEAGHDHFDYDLAHRVVGEMLPWHIKDIAGGANLSMSELAFNMSKASNAVSKKHMEVTKHLFPGKDINFITNGVHHLTWTGKEFKKLFDKHIPDWMLYPEHLKKVLTDIPDNSIWQKHQENKQKLVRYINDYLTELFSEKFPIEKEDLFDDDILTITYARRSVPYKRPLLIYRDLERLLKMGSGKLQIIHAGKCSPGDRFCLHSVDNIVDLSRDVRGKIRIVYLDNYNIELAKILTSGSDVWLNTPKRPLEASGTSGMKAAMNGVLNLSIKDGWWTEAIERDPLCGWAFGGEPDEVEPADTDKEDANDLYNVLENQIIPAYYSNRSKWLERMRHSIALGEYFNTHRCVKEYSEKLWGA
jgi:starch phosphorylase